LSLPLEAVPHHVRPRAAVVHVAAAWIWILGIAAASRAAEGLPEAPAGAGGGVVAVRVGDTPIFRAEVDAVLRRVTKGRSLDADRESRLAAETIEQLVDERLLRREVDARQITIDEDEVTAIVARMRGQLSDRKIPFETFLAESGRDEASLRGQIRLELALNRMLLPQLTTATLDAAYARHRRELDGTVVRVSHIVLRPDPGRGIDALDELVRRAAVLRTSILRGDMTFAEAARRHSAGPSRRQGGDLGYLPRHGAMDEEFSRRAFALAKGEMSQPFATSFGVHLVLLTDVKPGDVGRDAVRPQLEKLVLQDAIRDIVVRGRRQTAIEYAPGVPHFAPDPDPDQPGRRVVITAPAGAAP